METIIDLPIFNQAASFNAGEAASPVRLPKAPCASNDASNQLIQDNYHEIVQRTIELRQVAEKEFAVLQQQESQAYEKLAKIKALSEERSIAWAVEAVRQELRAILKKQSALRSEMGRLVQLQDEMQDSILQVHTKSEECIHLKLLIERIRTKYPSARLSAISSKDHVTRQSLHDVGELFIQFGRQLCRAVAT